MSFRLVKQYWRLILGVGFAASGFSYVQTAPVSGWATAGVGVALMLWHLVRLVLAWRASGAGRR